MPKVAAAIKELSDVLAGAWTIAPGEPNDDRRALVNLHRAEPNHGAPPSAVARTMLLWDLTAGKETLDAAVSWAAEVRQDLPEPRASALYLVVLAGKDVGAERSANIEADERFCRKLVWKDRETAANFARRTFLSLGDLAQVDVAHLDGPRARILDRIEKRSISRERGGRWLDALAELPGEVDVVSWLQQRLSNPEKR